MNATNSLTGAKPISWNSGTRLPFPVRAAAWAQLAIAGAAFFVEVLGICGGCETGGPRIRLAIASAGLAGYACLALAGELGRARLFHVGLAIAAGIHSALVLWMAAAGALCLTCAIAAAGVATLLTVSLVWRTLPWRTLWGLFRGAFVPALLLAGVFAWSAARAEAARETEQELAITRGQVFPPRPISVEGALPLRIAVYESERCPYCLEFRADYLPRLKRDFKGRIEIRFVDAREATWVRRTPTILVEGGPVWEGLPLRYADLRDVVAEELARGGSAAADRRNR